MAKKEIVTILADFWHCSIFVPFKCPYTYFSGSLTIVSLSSSGFLFLSDCGLLFFPWIQRVEKSWTQLKQLSMPGLWSLILAIEFNVLLLWSVLMFSCPKFGHWEHIKLPLMFFLAYPINTIRCSSLIWYLSCSDPEIVISPRILGSFLVENGI